LQLPFVCIHGANDTIALPASSQYVYDHAGTDPAHKSVHLIADSKHEPFHESPAIRTAAIDFVVKYFEEQYQVRLPRQPQWPPLPARRWDKPERRKARQMARSTR
jgi:alpha-beta hydrolase superfamily lysophospholipase